MLTKINKIVIMSFLVMLITSCGGGSGANFDPTLNMSGATGSITLSAIEDDTTKMTMPFSYMVSSTEEEDIEEELWYLKIYVVNKTQDTVFVDYADLYYSEEQLLFFKINQKMEINISPVSDGDEIAIILVHFDDSWERYTATVHDSESISVSPYSGDEAYAQNEADDYTSPEELWCYIGCDACSDDQEGSQEIGTAVSGNDYFREGVCPEE